jgi:hypothetical protein
MRSTKLITLVLLATGFAVVTLASSQEANPPQATKESKKASGKGSTPAKQTGDLTAIKAERLALQRDAEAMETRHQALDAEIAAWSEEVGRWIKKNKITIDPASVVLSLSSRSFFLHDSAHSGSSGDPDYAHLEDQMKAIQAKRKEIESDWLRLLSRDRASIAKSHLKPAKTQQTFDFGFGDSTIPIPGVSARQNCCSLTLPGQGATLHGCKLTGESCEKAGSKWHHVCSYTCDPIVLSIP